MPTGAGIFDTPNLQRLDKDQNIKDRHIVTDQETKMLHGQKIRRTFFNTVASGSVYSLATNEYLLGVTNLSYAPTIGLPQPKLVGEGKTYLIKDEAGGAGTTTITIVSAGEETIDGASTTTLINNYALKGFYSDGANWFII